MRKEKIEEDDLLLEIIALLRDEFVAKMRVSREEKTVRMRFANGQSFVVALWEEKH